MDLVTKRALARVRALLPHERLLLAAGDLSYGEMARRCGTSANRVQQILAAASGMHRLSLLWRDRLATAANLPPAAIDALFQIRRAADRASDAA